MRKRVLDQEVQEEREAKQRVKEELMNALVIFKKTQNIFLKTSRFFSFDLI